MTEPHKYTSPIKNGSGSFTDNSEGEYCPWCHKRFTTWVIKNYKRILFSYNLPFLFYWTTKDASLRCFTVPFRILLTSIFRYLYESK